MNNEVNTSKEYKLVKNPGNKIARWTRGVVGPTVLGVALAVGAGCGTDEPNSHPPVADAQPGDLDVTPPPAPKILTNNNGEPWDPGKGDIEIEGTCDSSDTAKIQVIDNGTTTTNTEWTDIKVTFDNKKGTWIWNTKVKPMDGHKFKFRAVDEAGNESKPSDTFYVEWAE